MSWHVYIACSLCAARTKSFTDADHEVAGAAARENALEFGFVPLPASDNRRRSAGHICGDCMADVAAAAPKPIPCTDETNAVANETGAIECRFCSRTRSGYVPGDRARMGEHTARLPMKGPPL